VMIFSPLIDDLQASDNSNFFLAYQNTSQDFLQLRGADFQDGRELKWDMGMIPFDVSLLYNDGRVIAAWVGEDGVFEEWSELGDTVIILNGEMTFTRVLPKGSYRCFILWAGDSGTTNGKFEANTTVLLGTITNATIPDAGTYDYIDIIVTDPSATITFSVWELGNVNYLNCGGVMIWPIGNSKNFPRDVRDQSLRVTRQKLRGAKK